MQISYVAKVLKDYTNSLLDREGWGLVFKTIIEEDNKITIIIRKQFLKIAEDLFKIERSSYNLPVFNSFIEEQNEIFNEAANKKYRVEFEQYTIFKYRKRILLELGQFFKENHLLLNLYTHIQDTNFSHIYSLNVKSFFSIKNILLTEIKGSKEVYLLGENGDGKSLILMAIHLAFNGRNISRNTNFEFTGKIQDIIDKNKKMRLSSRDINGIVYGGSNSYYLKNLFAYGVHRGRYSTDNFEPYGYMSLYDSDLQLYNPVQLLKQTFLLQLEKNLDKNNMIGENKKLPTWVPLGILINLFQELLENNVSINVSLNEVKFIEKGFEISFDQLSEGYKNLMIWVSDMIYRFQQSQPDVGSLTEFKGVVLVDEIELHLHLIWQRKLITQLRYYFPNVQFVFTTHSPTIIQGASNDAIIYRISRDNHTGETTASEAYFKKNLDHLMLNTLVTSPLFGLDDARVSSNADNIDTSDDYIQSRLRKKIDIEVQKKKEAGDNLLDEEEIDSIIDKILNEDN